MLVDVLENQNLKTPVIVAGDPYTKYRTSVFITTLVSATTTKECYFSYKLTYLSHYYVAQT